MPETSWWCWTSTPPGVPPARRCCRCSPSWPRSSPTWSC
nr:unnamed protein product [Callosobruchus analis]